MKLKNDNKHMQLYTPTLTSVFKLKDLRRINFM